MGVNLTIPATFEDALSTPEQIEWLYRNKESLLQAGANIEITRSGDRTTITAKGEGFSPTVSVVEIEGGHEVTITDGTGEHVFDVMDGVDGTSVTVTSASITGGHRLTIVSASGTTTVDVMDGTDGTDGQDGDSIVVKSVDTVEGGVNLTVTDKNGDHVIFLMNGPQGLTGPAATIQVGSTTTGEPGSNASVTNVGTSSNAVFNFAIPAGADGEDGQDGTDGRNVFIKYADAEPTSDDDMKDVPSAWIGIYNGTATSAPTHYTSYQWYNFKGAKGDDGADGSDGQDGAAATVTVGSTTTGAAGSSASVTNSGTTSAAVLDFVIPKGDKGDTGDTGDTGPAGADGVGVPTGGTTGQVLKKASGTDYDTEWGDDEGLPSGGNNGDVLTKATTGPMWAAPVKELPVIASGDAGKVLTVNSGETGTEWATPSSGGGVDEGFVLGSEDGKGDFSIDLDNNGTIINASSSETSKGMFLLKKTKYNVGSTADKTDIYAPSEFNMSISRTYSSAFNLPSIASNSVAFRFYKTGKYMHIYDSSNTSFNIRGMSGQIFKSCYCLARFNINGTWSDWKTVPASISSSSVNGRVTLSLYTYNIFSGAFTAVDLKLYI